MALSNVQQQLFSYFNLTKVASLDSTMKVFLEILTSLGVDTPRTEKFLLEEISEINQTTKNYDLEIVESIDELTGVKLFILINTADNFVTRKSKFYDASTSDFFSKIIKDCILSEEGYLSETHCINLSSQVKIRKTVAESVLEELINDKWLVSQRGRISLGMRTIVELEQNIKQLYSDAVKHCPFCKLIIVQGCICSNCKIRCHHTCWEKFMKSRSKCVCPNCKQVWNYEPLEMSVKDFQNSEDNVISTAASAKRRKSSMV